MDSEISSLKIVMFPWLAHGHIFPYLELAKRILNKKNFHIYLCTTAVNFPSITTFLHKNYLQNSIEIIQLHLQPHPNPELPPHLHTTKNLPSHLRLPLLKAFQTAKSSFSHILADLNPDLIIFDVFQPWAATAAASLRIPAVYFAPFGAATMSYIHHSYTAHPDPDFPFPQLLLRPTEKASLDSLVDFLLTEVFDHHKNGVFVNYDLSSEVVLLKTSPSLEGKYINYVSSASHKRILPVGPLVAEAEKNGGEQEENSDIMRWLDEKEVHSTVYISFGSEYFLSDEEIAEIVKGLELCKANFIWVIRFPAMEERQVLPDGFLERMRERGRVVMGWAPQASILRHPSVGAFVSHCGWSSVNESVYYGVPVVGMPVKINMFVDARMLVEAGACVEVEREGDGGFKGEDIGKAIDHVVVGGERQGLRRRVRELSEKMKMEEEEAIDQVAHQLWQLCCTCKNKITNTTDYWG